MLDADPNRSATAYEQLRHRTIALLQWWGAADAEDLADVTLDRVARKLEEQAVIKEGSLGAYVRGVARMVFYESRRRPRVRADDLPRLSPAPSTSAAALGCLDSCLDRLERSDRELVLGYYADGKAAEVRRRLAGERHFSMAALRVRAHRLRTQLEGCVRECTAVQ